MIRGTKRPRANAVEIIEPKAQKIEAKLNASIHNRFDIEVVDAKTGEIKQRAQAENVICTALWTRLFTPNTYFNYIHYGTGSGTPATNDTSLFSFLGYGTPDFSDDTIDVNAALGYASYRRKIQLTELVAVGATITEVGIGYSTTAATLCTHAMLKDMNGNQISIAKTNTDILNIYATVFVHWPAAGEDSGHIQVLPYLKQLNLQRPLLGFLGFLLGSYAPRNLSKGWYSATPPDYLQPVNGNVMPNISPVEITSTYSLSTKTITLTGGRLAASSFNDGGFLGIRLFASGYGDRPADLLPIAGSFYVKVGGTWFPYSSITTENIGTGDGTTKDFVTEFPFPYDATIYVNGIITSAVTVEARPLLTSDMGQYFDGLSGDSTTEHHILEVSAPNLSSSLASLGGSFTSDQTVIYYNPNHSIGIASLMGMHLDIYVSNDLSTWIYIGNFGTFNSLQNFNVPSEYQNYKYWRFYSEYSGLARVSSMTAPSTYSNKSIHFDTAPEAGAIITADYKTPCVAKDINHVFDFSMVISLGEYTE